MDYHLNLKRVEVSSDPAFQHAILANRAEVDHWMKKDRALESTPCPPD
jgi:hypothetical protein